jgi:membrane fusion protein, copper/silver efflux system
MTKNIIITLLAIAVVGLLAWKMIGRTAASTGHAIAESATHPETEGDYYTCPMHPSVRSDKPGACPVCGMALVKKSGVATATSEKVLADNAVALSPAQRVLANITTATVERKTIKKEITAVGVVDFAEPNYLHISTRFPGRLERLYLTYTGQMVKKGDPVADVYSPEAISAQQEFLLTLEAAGDGGDSPSRDVADLQEKAKQKLVRWGFTDEQIAELKKSREVQRLITIVSPVSGTVLKKNVDPQHYAAMGEDIYDIADLSTVWIYLDVYEKDIRHLKLGQSVTITTESSPGESFAGRVTFIDPVLNADTRTIRVRTEFANRAGKLKPNMYVRASITVQSTQGLVVPSSAILSTGKRNLVWMEVNENVFKPRDVKVGLRTETYTEILDGVDVGDDVAETGGFLIDSESALSAPAAPDPHGEHRATSMNQGKEPVAHPSEYFKQTEVTAKENEASVLVKGKYTPEIIHVKAGKPVTLHFYRDEDSDCTNEVMFEGLNIRKRLPARETTTIVFTPADTGEIPFSCGMGMVRGKLIVEK